MFLKKFKTKKMYLQFTFEIGINNKSSQSNPFRFQSRIVEITLFSFSCRSAISVTKRGDGTAGADEVSDEDVAGEMPVIVPLSVAGISGHDQQKQIKRIKNSMMFYSRSKIDDDVTSGVKGDRGVTRKERHSDVIEVTRVVAVFALELLNVLIHQMTRTFSFDVTKFDCMWPQSADEDLHESAKQEIE